MKKSDLVAGKHVVKLRNGDNYLVLESKKNVLILSNILKWDVLKLYKEDLTYKTELIDFKNFDIIKVGLIDFVTLDTIQNDNRIEWIWERKELKHNVGDCFESISGNFIKITKIRECSVYPYRAEVINEYGERIDFFGIFGEEYLNDNYKPCIPIERPEKKEMTIKEIEEVLGYEIKVVK